MLGQLRGVMVAGLGGLLIGAWVMSLWQGTQYPGRPLFVEVQNTRNETIPVLTLEHGSDFAQEKLLLSQLRAGETRLVSLNHEPGRGYSVALQLVNGETIEACVGKSSTKWVNRVLITSNGIFGGD